MRAVYDGDTVKVRFKDGREKIVRLIGIDAPEMDVESEQEKFRAQVSKRFTFYYLYNQKVDLTYDWELEDDYGRLLAYIWTEDQGLFNKFIVRKGFAYVFLRFPFRYKKEFREAEREARQEKRGLWKEKIYPFIPPEEAKKHVGELLTVKYRCVEIEWRDDFLFLHSPQQSFSALIEKKNTEKFPEVKNYQGKIIYVSGFLEEYKGNPQIMLFSPFQINLN